MSKRETILFIIAITLLLLVGIRCWAYNPISGWPTSVLSGDETDYQIINRIFPFHIINPVNIFPDEVSSVIVLWQVKEFRARTFLLIIIWVVLIILTLKMRKASN